MPTPTIIALGGGGFSSEPDNPLLDDYILAACEKLAPRICFLPTASGDADAYIVRFYTAFSAGWFPNRRPVASHLALFRRTIADLRGFLLAQDFLYIGGGNTANMLATWRVHGLDVILREAWDRGIILCGPSAGAVCWFEAGVTDSFGLPLRAITGGLAFLPGSFCPHYDSEPSRRPVYQRLVVDGTLSANPNSPCYAADDSVALKFANTHLTEVVTSRPNARAWQLTLASGHAQETELQPRYLGANT